MATETEDAMEMGSKPVKEHSWLPKLVGEWKTETEMTMPDGSKMTSKGTESVRSLGGLWSYAEGKSQMPGGAPMEYYMALGYDLTFKEYRGCMIMSASSHLWIYVGTLSADGGTMTLDCEGPNMMGEGTAMYRDVIEIIDDNHRTLTSNGQLESGEWAQFMKAHYTRV
jgi:hypothetical protein